MQTTYNPPYLPRIYIHAPYKPDPHRAEVKKAVLEKIRQLGFDPQEFHISGLPKGDAWTFDRAIEVMHQCDGALILALMRWTDSDVPIPSEYSHFEGALALACDLPTLVLAEEGMAMRGILSQVGGSFVLQIPIPRDNVLLEAGYFMSAHSARRLVVVREKGTKMPADLGGMIYLTIEDRGRWEETAREVADSLRVQMAEDA